MIAFDEDQLNEYLNEEIEEFSNLLNEANKLKQRENVAKGTISHATSNAQSGIVELENNKKIVEKAQEDNKKFVTAFVNCKGKDPKKGGLNCDFRNCLTTGISIV